MASVRDRLKKVKPTAKNAVEKYREILEYTLRNVQNSADQKVGLEAFLTAGEVLAWYIHVWSLKPLNISKVTVIAMQVLLQ